MKITIIQVGKTKATYFQEAEQEYEKRLKPFVNLSRITVKESSIPKGDAEASRKIVKDQEAETILRAVPAKTVLIALDENGEEMTSPQFAEFMRKSRDFEGGNMTFIIGGSYGLSPLILSRAKRKIAFSKLTFTHEMVRTLLLEQLYRAFSIVSGKTYHY